MSTPIVPHQISRGALGAPRAARRSHRGARLTGWGRVLSLLVLLAFGRAAVVPPCEAHGGMDHGGSAHATATHATGAHAAATHATGAHEVAAPPTQDDDAPHGGTCICIGACHHAAAAAWIASEPPRVEVAAQAFLETPTADSRPVVSRAHHPHVLPFATAPPTFGA